MSDDQNKPEQTPAQTSNNEPTPAPAPAPATAKLIPTKRSTLLWMLGVLIIGILVILWAWRIGPFATSVQQTDNSYVKGKTTILSSQINGYVKDVLVKDFDHVKRVKY